MKTLLTIFLMSGICFALPEVNDLTLREQRLVWELSKPELGNLESLMAKSIAKKEALTRSDLNHDGTIDLADFAMFASDYSLFMPVVEPIVNKEVVELKVYADFNDPCFVDWYINDYVN